MKQFPTRALQWAQAEPAVRAMFMVGSRVRRHPPADEWADLDFELFADGYDGLLSDTGWLHQLGPLWTTVVINEPGVDGEQAVLALFDGGYKVDFHFRPAELLAGLVKATTLPEPFIRGYRLLLDKDGQAAGMRPAPEQLPPKEPPSPERFAATVGNFWYGAPYVAKQIRRRNLWVVKYRDWTMKESLLRMMEWHVGATRGWDTDTFNDGHFLKQWTDAATWKALMEAFGRFDADDSWKALFSTLSLFSRLAQETADRLGYPYDQLLDDHVTEYVAQLRAQDRPLPGEPTSPGEL